MENYFRKNYGIYRFKFGEIFDIKVPGSFKFLCKVLINETKEETDELVSGKYLYETLQYYTAEQIAKGYYPTGATFEISENNHLQLCMFECECVEQPISDNK